jgi:hypothetical protein
MEKRAIAQVDRQRCPLLHGLGEPSMRRQADADGDLTR